jgi:hypothetical protein
MAGRLHRGTKVENISTDAAGIGAGRQVKDSH